MITKPKKKETKTYLALIVIGIALVLGCPTNTPSSPASSVTESVPAKDATDFLANQPIVLTYSGTVVKGTGNITISQATEDDIVIPVTAAGVTLVVNAAATPPTTTVTITPPNDLEVGKITITIPAGAFKVTNADGADVAAYSLTFTAIEPPPVTKSVPPAGETKFPANGNIVLTYRGTVVKGTGNITITLATEDDIVIAVGDAQVTVEDPDTTAKTTTVTINPINDLPVDTVTVAIPAGAFKVTNADGADVAAYSLSFTAIAADTTAPIITKRVPAHLDTDVAIDADIVLTFDEVVLAGSGMITFAQSGCCSNVVIDVTSSQVTIDGNVVTINPEEDFITQIIYNAEIHAGTFVNYAGLSDEQDGSIVATASTWVFTTAAPSN